MREKEFEMIIMAWICLVFFGVFAITSIVKYFRVFLNKFHALMMFISVIIVALSAGIIWGGLFNNLF
jgi:hypothetical protein